ncbi:MAG: hypothetical protein WCE97_11855 [Candidatus Cybelea sp.]|jgi:hypothetical protein
MQRLGEVLEVEVGYAAGPAGGGVAYAALNGAEGREVVRLPFRIVRRRLLVERAVAYAALVTVARSLSKRGVTRAHFVMPDPRFVEEVTGRCDVPEALVLPYVRLRCALNAFHDVEIGTGATDELMQRAGAEVALNVAA